MQEDFNQEVETRLAAQKEAEAELQTIEQELNNNPAFQDWIAKQKTLKAINEANEAYFNDLKDKMEGSNTKSIKGDWGSITLAERQGWDIDEDQLPRKFFKRVVDTKKVTDTYRLEGKAPKGATPRVTRYLTKRFK